MTANRVARDRAELAEAHRLAPLPALDAEDYLARALVAISALRRLANDHPYAVAAAIADVLSAAEVARDEAVRELRASRDYGWPAIAEIVDVPTRTAIRRWGPQGLDYPGGLPEGGGHR